MSILPNNVTRVSASDAMAAKGLGWSVEQWPMYAVNGDTQERLVVPSHVANVRSDNRDTLGVVKRGYTLVQNADVGALAQELMEQDAGLSVTDCREFDGGRKTVVNLSGADFGGKDQVRPNLIIINGFDGGTSFQVIPSTFRMFCLNQLHMVGKMRRSSHIAVTLRHTRNIAERIEAAKHVLAAYHTGLEYTRELIAKLGSAACDKQLADKFFSDRFAADYYAIPAASGTLTATERRARERAILAYRAFNSRLTLEAAHVSYNVWAVLNAYTHVVQHIQPEQRQARTVAGREKQTERVAASNLFGANVERSALAFQAALALVA